MYLGPSSNLRGGVLTIWYVTTATNFPRFVVAEWKSRELSRLTTAHLIVMTCGSLKGNSDVKYLIHVRPHYGAHTNVDSLAGRKRSTQLHAS
jgi:hypothetical protein